MVFASCEMRHFAIKKECKVTGSNDVVPLAYADELSIGGDSMKSIIPKRTILILFAAALSACITPTPKKQEAVSVHLEFADSKPDASDGYQRILISSGVDEDRFCADSFAAAFTRNVISVGDRKALTLTLDDKQILLFTYDEKTRACKKENLLGNVLTSYKRADIASEENHAVHLAFVDSSQINTINEILKKVEQITAISGQPFLAAATKQPAEELAKMVDSVISKSKSYTDDRKTTFTFPYKNNNKLLINAVIDDHQYSLAEIDIERKESIFGTLSPKRAMSKPLIANQSPEAFLQLSHSGDENAVSQELIAKDCRLLRQNYQASLTEYDMQYLLESYLVSEHASHVGTQLTTACWDNADQNLWVSSAFKNSMAKAAQSQTSNRSTRFMEEFTQQSSQEIVSPALKLEYAPEGFAYKTVQDLLAAQNQGPARCYRFSQEPRIIYFVKSLDNTPYYFVAHLDQSYTIEEGDTGKRSKILRLEIYNNIKKVPDEYISQEQTCVNNYVLAFKK